MKRQNRIANCIMYVVLLAVTVITIFPLFYAVMQSLRTKNDGVDECNLWGDYFYMELLTRLTTDWRMYW